MSASEPEAAPGGEPKPTVVFLRVRGIVTIPQTFRERLGLETDDQLIVTVEDGRIVLTPATVIPRMLAPFDQVLNIEKENRL
jgi:AbrB family looped-hinge helix DNA binding protein